MAQCQFFIVTKPNGETEYISATCYMNALDKVRAMYPKKSTVTQPQKYGIEPALRPSGHTW